MVEYMKTGFGGEATDTTIANVIRSKPVWQLVPLLLCQLQGHDTRRHHEPLVQSLHSYCLASISRSLHLFTPDSFAGVPPLLVKRLLSRILSDRRYDFEESTTNNPDEATLWALSHLLDSESYDLPKSLTLAVPSSSVLDHLAPNPLLANNVEHPLIELPKLFASLQPSSTFLTTLTLDGMDGFVDDHNILALKWCTHLTVLWMNGCSKVTDSGIRLLASSLELPGVRSDPPSASAKSTEGNGRGMWRLRAWFLSGCKGISDRSMKSFARWPGLTVLDVRNTSCSTSAIDVFNRFSQSLFAGHNADCQPCTDGLCQLFASHASPATVLDNLNLTLTQTSSDDKIIALHLVPSSQPVPNIYLPQPPSTGVAKDRSSSDEFKKLSSFSSNTAFRSGGIGQLYGSGVSRIADEVCQQRNNLNTAMRMRYERDWLDSATPAQKRKRTMAENKAKKEGYHKPSHEFFDGEDHMPLHKAGKIYKERASNKSKRFVMGSGAGTTKSGVTGGIGAKGGMKDEFDQRKLMLVRMVNAQWDQLQWALPGSGSNNYSLSFNSISSTIKSSPTLTWMGGSSQSQNPRRRTNLVSDILGTARSTGIDTNTGTDPRQSSQRHSLSDPLAPRSRVNTDTPSQKREQPSSSPVSTATAAARPAMRNPFRLASKSNANIIGVKPLGAVNQPTPKGCR